MLNEAYQRVATLHLVSNCCSFIVIFVALSSATLKCARAFRVPNENESVKPIGVGGANSSKVVTFFCKISVSVFASVKEQKAIPFCLVRRSNSCSVVATITYHKY